MHSFKIHQLWFVVPALLVTAASAIAADQPAPVQPPSTFDELKDAVLNGKPLLDIRYRFEDVSQGGFAHDAQANTVRTRAGYETGVFDNFKVRFQVQNVMPVGSETYNDGVNNLSAYPSIADPRETAELYEGYLSWSGLPQSTLTFGRQAMAVDNSRWIGIADWRQLGQTVDALTAKNDSIPGLDLSYSYIFNVNRTNGPKTSTGVYNMHSHAIHAAYSLLPDVKLIGYSYLFDISNAPTLSTQNYGGRVEIKHALDDTFKAIFNAEYARQLDYANNPASYGVNYYLIEPGIGIGPVTAKFGYEVLSGNGTQALQTPIASLHDFNGWADKFTTTPANGLRNDYVYADYVSKPYNEWLGPTTIKGYWYNYTADAVSMHYGNEYDLLIWQNFLTHYNIGFGFFDYKADQFLTDTRKISVMFQVKF